MQVRVRVAAGAKKEALEVLRGRIAVSVRQKAEQGAANKRVIELIAKHFKVPVKNVRIIRGHATPSKIIAIHASA